MAELKHTNIQDLPEKRKQGPAPFEYVRRDFVPRGTGLSLVSVYEIPPGKSAYPYHYHVKNEETFFIISGEGMLKTPDGARAVVPGDLLYFPPNESGAHRLTNTHPTKNLVYIDFDVAHDLDACLYPDSGKVALWGKDINRVYRLEDNVDYYHRE